MLALLFSQILTIEKLWKQQVWEGRRTSQRSIIKLQKDSIHVTKSLYFKILTKNELDDLKHKVLNGIIGKTNKSPADGRILKTNNPRLITFLNLITDTSYEKLVALFVGSYFVNTLDQVMPRVKDEDFRNTRDNLGETGSFS